MDAVIECTHCAVRMGTWVAPGSTVRYWQCPSCGRTHSSCYREVFRSRAGVRVVREHPPGAEPPEPAATPLLSGPDPALLRALAHAWFARLEAEGRTRPRLPSLPRAGRPADRAHARPQPALSPAPRAPGRHR